MSAGRPLATPHALATPRSSRAQRLPQSSALVSFALTEAVVAEAETATSGGACDSIESDEDEGAEAEAAACAAEAHRAATAAAAAATFERRHESLALKRSAGKARQEAEAEAKRARRMQSLRFVQ